MLIMLSFSSFIMFTGCMNFFPFIHRSTSKTPNEFMALPEAAMQLCAYAIFLGLFWLKAALKDLLFMQVIAAPVLNNHDETCPLAHMLSLGLTLPPGAKTSKSFLHVAIETAQRLSISCGITSWLCHSGDTSPVSAAMGEVSFGCVSLSMYLLGQYLHPWLSVQG
jgi:hypothetical protein